MLRCDVSCVRYSNLRKKGLKAPEDCIDCVNSRADSMRKTPSRQEVHQMNVNSPTTFSRYDWSRTAEDSKLRDFLYRLTPFFGVIGRDDHVPVIFAKTETIIKKLGISLRTFRRRIASAIDAGLMIRVKGKGRRNFYIAKLAYQKPSLLFALQKLKEKGLNWVFSYLENAKIGTLNKKIGTLKEQVWHAKKNHSIIDTDSLTNLSKEKASASAPVLPKIYSDLEKVNKAAKLNWKPRKIEELANTLDAYFYEDVVKEFTKKIERLSKQYKPHKVFSIVLSDARQFANENGRSSYRPGFVGVHDKYAAKIRTIRTKARAAGYVATYENEYQLKSVEEYEQEFQDWLAENEGWEEALEEKAAKEKDKVQQVKKRKEQVTERREMLDDLERERRKKGGSLLERFGDIFSKASKESSKPDDDNENDKKVKSPTITYDYPRRPSLLDRLKAMDEE